MQTITLLCTLLLSISSIAWGQPRNGNEQASPAILTPQDTILVVENTQLPPPAGLFNAVPRFSTQTNQFIKNSSVYIDDNGNVQLNGIIKNNNLLAWPSTSGLLGQVLTSDGMGGLIFTNGGGGGSGNVSTASPFTANNRLVRTDTPNGATNIQESNITLDNLDNMTGLNTVTANTFVGNLTGTASNATNANTANTAVNFTGTLSGDVTGTQSATVVSLVGGQTAANVASATSAANAATNANTPNTIVKRDASGNFSAGTVTAALLGNVSGNATNFTGSLSGDVTGTQSATVVNAVGGQSAANVASATSAANAATNINTPDTIVKRDASGNFSASTVTATLVGNVSGNATNFTGSLSGDVTGTQSATIVNTVGGQSAANIASGTAAANAATNINTPDTIVKRDASGNFSAETVTAALVGNVTGNASTATSAGSFSGSLSGDVTGTQSATVVSTVGGQSAASVAAATVAANAATSTNTPDTIVKRDASGNFSAGTVTAALVGNVTGSASNNVLKTGDTMTGALTMANQNQIDLQALSGGNFVGLQGPSSLPSSYTLALPSTTPTGNQLLRANNTTPTLLEWFTDGGSVPPSSSETIYVAKYGNDITGNGSASAPYATLSQAITVANGLSSMANPISIRVSAGRYTENNNAGPITITAAGVSIIGDTSTSTVMLPSNLANNLLNFTATAQVRNIGFVAAGSSTATGISLSAGFLTTFTNCRFANFQTGVACTGAGQSYAFNGCLFAGNGTGLSINNTQVEATGSIYSGAATLAGPAANTGVNITGTNATFVSNNNDCVLCNNGLITSNNAKVTLNAINFRRNNSDIIQTSASICSLNGCNFEMTNNLTDVKILASDAGTQTNLIGCEFNGNNTSGIPQATCLQAINNALIFADSCSISNYVTAIIVGNITDSSSTSARISSTAIRNCTNDLIQNGSSTVAFYSSIAASNKIFINDDTNINLAFFDLDDNSALTIGSFGNIDTTLLQAAITQTNHPAINYKTSLYNSRGIGYENTSSTPSSWFVESQDSATLTSITTDRTKDASLALFSDTGSPFGSTTALRGWTIAKNGSSGELSFQYQNTDTVGQASVIPYIMFQLDGVNNQVQLPNASTKLVFNGDTDLYRGSANVLKTDSNFIVAPLSAGYAVITDPITDQLSSSITTSTELGYLSGVTSSVQTQLNNKVSKSGDTMTGALQLPAGSSAAPALNFTGSTNTGLSASSGNLSLNTNGAERMKISSSGTVSINGFTTAGVVHNDASGNLSTSLIVNADVSPSAAIVDTKLATISTAGKVANSATTATTTTTPNTIVLRDANGNFSAGTVTAALVGNVTGSASNNVLKAGDTMTGALVMATQNQIDFQAASGGNFVGLQGPTSLASSYTLALPNTSPTVGQTLRAGSVTPTQLEWISEGGSVDPAVGNTIYVTTYGNDITGDGSFDQPYASLAKAITEANVLAATAPVTILVGTGSYIEDNSAGPISITSNEISIIGATLLGVYIIPNTLSNDLLTINNTAHIENLTFFAGGVSTATAVTFTAGVFTNASNITVIGFDKGISCSGVGSIYALESCFFNLNGTGLYVNNTTVQCNNPEILGSDSLVGPPANTGVVALGSNTRLNISAGTCGICQTGFNINTNADVTINGTIFQLNENDIVQSSSSILTLTGCSSTLTYDANVVNIDVSGAGTFATITGCNFNGKSLLGTPQGIALKVTSDANVMVNSCSFTDYTTGLQVGSNSDAASTILSASSTSVQNCTNDIIQNGSSTLSFDVGLASDENITINDPTNVSIALFDSSNANIFTIGSGANVNTQLLQVYNGVDESQTLEYKTNIYGTQAIGFENDLLSPTCMFAASPSDTGFTSITTDRTKISSITLVSDTTSPFGGTTALRGWTIAKNGTSGDLSFQYQNTDTIGQASVVPYIMFQLDGVNNQVQLPNAATKLVFDTDTNLYRSSANVLKTDSNFIVAPLSAGYAVITDPITDQLSSSITTSTELSYLSGVTSAVQTQLNNKVSKSGDTMTGALQLPAGSSATPSLTFTGSTNTGLSANNDNLSFNTNGTERMKISSSGTVLINGFTTAGIVHNDASGDLSTNLIVNADVSPTAGITDSKLATISTPGKVTNAATTATNTNTANAIVSRDASGNFAANIITASLVGNVTGNASGNVLKSGDTMSGTLVLPAGTSFLPSLKFSGSTNTGISAPSANTLSFDTNGTQAMHINSSGIVAIDGFSTDGVVHNDTSGNLSSSLIINNDITDATIGNEKLATISSANTSGNIVVRDGSGNFATNMITLNGATTLATDAATKAYVDSVAATGLSPKDPAIVVSTSNQALSGLPTIDGVTLVATDQVLLVNQTDPIENGLWVVSAGAWTRPTDFASGSTAGQAYVLILSGNTYAGSSWLCSTPTAVVDTDPLFFVEFSLPNQTTGANVGTGAGQIYQGKSGVTLNFKTIAAGTHMNITNNSDDITIFTDATDANSANTLVARDGSGNFSAGTITAHLVGSASNNVLKSGDSMTGALTMLTQNAINFDDAGGGQYIGIQAPATVPTSYTIALPSATPTAGQVLRAGSTTPTNLTWATEGATTAPAASRTIYVTKYGNDATGNGSFDQPYASLAQAITIANSLSSMASPVTIEMGSGSYVENNSTGPLLITASGISIVGASPIGTVIMPSTLSQDLLSISGVVVIENIEFYAPGVSTAQAISFTNGLFSNIKSSRFINFQTGIMCSNSNAVYALDNCFFNLNSTALYVNDTHVQCNNCNLLGNNSIYGPPTNTGIVATGANTILNVNGGTYSLCTTAFNINTNANVFIDGVMFELNSNDIVQNSAAKTTITGCSFAITNDTSDIEISASGAGTNVAIIGCSFDGRDLLGVAKATAIFITDSANVTLNSSSLNHYTTALQVGINTDTSSTILTAAATAIQNCTNHIIQSGSATLDFNACIASDENITINDPTYVKLAIFDTTANNVLTIGSGANVDTALLQVYNGVDESQTLEYKTNIYNTQALGFENDLVSPTSMFVVSSSDTGFTSITTDRTKKSSITLVSDTASPFGGTTALRGWTIAKNGTSGELSFQYQNTDTVGQSSVIPYIMFQLDGVNNQVQLPNASTKLVFDTDTNLYRSSANVLKTDDNLIVAPLSAGYAVTTDPITNQLSSSITTNTELGYLSGVTSSVQTQLDNKVSKSGDTMTGALQLPAGSSAAPALNFTGSTTTGLSASSGNLSLNTNGTERMKISSGGTVSINGFTTAGVVHNDASGNLSTSLIVNADVSPTAAIADTKLATISTAGKVANSATTATTANTPNTIVLRDANGNFSAGTVTAALVGNVTGSASNNVLKAGDTMTGTLVMATQNQIDYQAASGGNYVGIEGPDTLASSYTLKLPSTTPIVGQTLRAGSVTATQLEWVSEGGSVDPAISNTIYVTTYGNDITGDGSFDQPYASLAAAIDLANTISTATTPVLIEIASGTYTEDNSAGPITITADGISIVGASTLSVIIKPSTLSNDLLTANAQVQTSFLTFEATGASTASAITVNSGNSTMSAMRILNFKTGIKYTGSTHTHRLYSSLLALNETGLDINDTIVNCNNCDINGNGAITPANTGIALSGSNTVLNLYSSSITACQTGLQLNNNASAALLGAGFALNNNHITQNSGAQLIVNGCTFALTANSADVSITVQDAGSYCEIVGCDFNGKNFLGVAQGTCLSVSNDAEVYFDSSTVNYYITGIVAGISSDTAATMVNVAGTNIQNCTNDIIQNGSTSLDCNAVIASSDKISINNSTNVHFAFFDLDDNNALTIGSFNDIDTTLIEAGVTQNEHPAINYKSSLYNTSGIGYENPTTTASTWFVESQNNAAFDAITTNRANAASLSLFSDTGSLFGGTSALRGWTIAKNASTAELSFQYQNTDTVGQASVVPYIMFQLDGVNNQVQLPNASTKLVFDTDTNLYRSSANVLKTDDNFIVAPLSAGYAVITDSITNQLSSSITTNTELGYLSGVISPVQTQLNNKVSRSGDTMTGALQLPAGSNAAPALTFTGSATTGLSASSGNLSLNTNGSERMKISSGGTVSINGFTTAGVVHNDASGNLSTSLIVNADIDPAAAIVDTKLATISTPGKVANSATTATTANTPNTIVLRDANGNFNANTITATLQGNITGNAATATSAGSFSGSLSGDVTGTQSATVVSTVGGQSASNVASATVAANAATSTNTANTIVKRDASGNFSANTITATLQGNITGNAATATTATSATNFTGSLSGDVTGTQSATVVSTVGGQSAANVASATTAANAATSANTPNTIVKRDASGNFSAGTVTAALVGNVTGNATTATNATNFTGSLSGDVTGTQSATVVSTVGGQSAANVASGTAAANAATSTNTANTIVKRDASGNFSAGTVTAALVGNITGNATNFTGSLSGDVTGTQSATVVNSVGGQSAANVASATVTTNAATSTNTANAIVKRDASGNFSAGTVTAALVGNVTGSASNNVLKAGDTMTGTLVHPAGSAAAPSIQFTGSTNTGISAATANTLSFDTNGTERMNIGSTGTVTINGLNTAGIVHNNASGALSTSLIVNADIDPAAAIADTKLATISTAGKVANSATTATAANTPSTIVLRDASSNFNANTITATLQGNITGNAATATSAGSFSGSLSGDVTGTQSATVVSTVGGQSAANVASATVAANAATSTNTANTIVKRDASGAFSAGTVTAVLAGHATLDVLKSGDTMTGALTMATQNAVNYQAATGGNSVGLRGPSTLASSYTLSLPTSSPTANQVLRASSTTPTQLTWITEGGSVVPATSKTIYVAPYGNDTTGDGSFNTPYATLSKAITIANGISTATTPVTIVLAEGAYTENNNSGALTITTDGISIVGASEVGTIITPTSLSQTLLSTNNTVYISNVTFKVSGASSATALSCTAGYYTLLSKVNFINFQTGFYCEGSNSTYILDTCVFNNNGTGLSISNATVNGSNCNFSGSCSTNQIPLNTGITVTGSSALLSLNSSSCTLCGNALTIANSAQAFLNGITFKTNIYDIFANTGAQLSVGDSDFLITYSSADIKINVNGSNTFAEILGCTFNGLSSSNTVQGTALQVTNGGSLYVSGGSIANYATGLIDGLPINDSSTSATVIGLYMKNNTTDITQNGSTSLTLNESIASSTKLSFNNTSNVFLSYNDLVSNNALTLSAGSAAEPSLQFNGSTNTGISAATANTLSFDTNGTERINIGSTGTVTINGLNTAGVVHTNASGALSTSLIVNADVDPAAAIADTKLATISTAGKVSNSATTATSANTANAIVARDASGNFSAGTVTAALVGNVTGNATNFTGSLSGDVTGTQSATVVSTVGGQSAVDVASATVAANAATSTNTANAIVARDASGNFSAGVITASLTGAASLNVLKAGDTMTGALQLPAGTAAAPTLKFTGSTNTGISAATANTLSFDTNGAERMNINTTTINAIATLAVANAFCLQGFQTLSFTGANGSVTVSNTTSILLLKPNNASTTITITFPASPTNGQILMIVSALASKTITLTYSGATIVNPVNTLNPAGAWSNTLSYGSVTYVYNSADNIWYRIGRA